MFDMIEQIREWIGTLGTLAALGWAVFLYWKSLRDKEMDQARLLSVVPLEPEVVGVGDTFEIYVAHGNVGGTTSHEFVEFRRDDDVSVSRATKQLTLRRIEIVNNSQEVVSALTATLETADGGSALASAAQVVYLRSGELHRFTFFMERDVEHWFSRDGDVRIVVRFTDNLGMRWSKVIGGPLRRLKPGGATVGMP
jgi:hypothetical protein